MYVLVFLCQHSRCNCDHFPEGKKSEMERKRRKWAKLSTALRSLKTSVKIHGLTAEEDFLEIFGCQKPLNFFHKPWILIIKLTVVRKVDFRQRKILLPTFEDCSAKSDCKTSERVNKTLFHFKMSEEFNSDRIAWKIADLHSKNKDCSDFYKPQRRRFLANEAELSFIEISNESHIDVSKSNSWFKNWKEWRFFIHLYSMVIIPFAKITNKDFSRKFSKN